MKKEIIQCDTCGIHTLVEPSVRIISTKFKTCAPDICEKCLKKMFVSVGYSYHIDPQGKDSICELGEESISFIDK